MRALEVELNGERLCLAGIGDDGVLNAMVNCIAKPPRQEVELRVGGLISPTREHVDWVNRDISVGDEIRIRIVDAGLIDEPSKRHRPDPAVQLKAQKNYVRHMAKDLGWEVKARSRKQGKRRRK